MTKQEEVQSRIREYQQRLGEASVRWGRVDICAVTKAVEADVANFAYDMGVRIVGENRVQEILRKSSALHPEYRLHLIGRLQTNKIKYILPCVDMVQSLDRDALAVELDRQARMADRVMPVLVQVNIAREAQKGGIAEEELLPFLQRIAGMKGISVRGLMTIMPLVANPEELRPYFRKMRKWFERLKEAQLPGLCMDVLSMGMSNDCLVAAEEGATMVRLGTAIFGARQ